MPTILVIDDDRLILKMVSDTLKKSGFQVLATVSPDDAFRLDLGTVSAIVCDFNMPEMNGVEVLQALRELKSCHAPFIFLTSHGALDDLIPMAIKYQAELLPKPFEAQELITLLKKQLGAQG